MSAIWDKTTETTTHKLQEFLGNLVLLKDEVEKEQRKELERLQKLVKIATDRQNK